MGPFEWLASRWTPEFEYRDRLADEVEDIAFESTKTGTRRGLLIGVLLGAILALIGIGALASNGVQIPFLSTAGLQEGHQEAKSPQLSSDELSILKQENEQLKRELATAKALALPTREKRATETKSPRPKAEPTGEFPPREKRVVETTPPEPKAEPTGALPPREKRVVETKPPEPQPEAPAARPPKTATKDVAIKSEGKVKAPDSVAAQPIPSNCRKEGDCDPVRP